MAALCPDGRTPRDARAQADLARDTSQRTGRGQSLSIVALVVGGSVGWLVGIGFWRAILYVSVPVMAGGAGEGAIPLAVDHAQALGVEQGMMIGRILPLVFFGNLVAIVCCGALNTMGRRHPAPTGHGRLLPT